MSVFNVDLEKKKKQPARFSCRRLGCMFLMILPFLVCGLCYASTWLFGKYGGEWASFQTDSPLPESILIAHYTAQEGFTRYAIQVYAVPETLEEVQSRFPFSTPGSSDHIIIRPFETPNVDSVDIFNRAWRFAFNSTMQTNFDANRLCYAVADLYRTEKTAHFSVPKSIVLPSNTTILVVQTCFFGWGRLSLPYTTAPYN